MLTPLKDFRAMLRRSILKDEAADPNKYKWSDDSLTDLIGWALDTFCAHTAQPSTVLYQHGQPQNPTDPTVCWDMGVDTVFPLPDDVFEKPDLSGRVKIEVDGRTGYYDPVNYSQRQELWTGHGFYTWPETSLVLTSAPGTGATLTLYYFAFWPHPVLDTDPIPGPRWALPALAHLVGAYALSGYAMRSANIAQWKEKPEAGTPEDNALRSQQRWLLEMYEQLLLKYPRQDRENFWRDMWGNP